MMEKTSEFEKAMAVLNMAIVQEKIISQLLKDIEKQISVIHINSSNNSVHLAQGLDKLADYYGAEIKRNPEFSIDKYDEYFFTVDGIEYFELRNKEGVEEQC